MFACAACSFVRSLDDLGNGVRPDDLDATGGGEGGMLDAPLDTAIVDVAIDAPIVCGPEIDLKTDAKNCGVCGNACHDADTCDLGACVVATSTNETAEVVVGGGWLVYNDGTAIWARPTSGGDRVALADPHSTVLRIATDGVEVVWTTDDGSNGAVYRCPIAGCASGPTVIATAQNHPRGITLDGKGHVYWATSGGGVGSDALAYRCNGSNGSRPLGMVRYANVDGTGVVTDFIKNPDVSKDSITDLSHVLLHGPNVYWTNASCDYTGGKSPAHIWKLPVDGDASVAEVFLVGGDGCHWSDFVADDTDFHFACEYTRVSTVAQAPASMERVWAPESPTLELPRATSDGVRVFWTNSEPPVADASVGARKVYAIAKTATPGATKPSLLWEKDNRFRGLRGITVDDRTIYFADPDDHKIRALAK